MKMGTDSSWSREDYYYFRVDACLTPLFIRLAAAALVVDLGSGKTSGLLCW